MNYRLFDVITCYPFHWKPVKMCFDLDVQSSTVGVGVILAVVAMVYMYVAVRNRRGPPFIMSNCVKKINHSTPKKGLISLLSDYTTSLQLVPACSFHSTEIIHLAPCHDLLKTRACAQGLPCSPVMLCDASWQRVISPNLGQHETISWRHFRRHVSHMSAYVLKFNHPIMSFLWATVSCAHATSMRTWLGVTCGRPIIPSHV